jgi:acyl dehydratase
MERNLIRRYAGCRCDGSGRMSGDRLWFDDMEEGQVYEAGPVEVTEDRIIAFAREFDPQAQHVDVEAAKSTPFEGLAASGWHTAAVTMRLIHEAVILRFGGGGMGLGVDELRWLLPVRPGDRLRARMVVGETRRSGSKPGFGIVPLSIETLNQDGVVVMRMKTGSLLRCRPA